MTTALRYVGTPDGPNRFIAEFGCETPTFTIPHGGPLPALDYHVPPNMRGDFRPKDLANYDSEKDYRTDNLGKVLCYGTTKAGNKCRNRAVNRYPRCEFHGGRLHPLDKLIKDKENATNQQEGQALSRYRQFQAGQITVDDLDDEELAACGFRATNGAIFKPRNIPREMAQAFTRAIYERANAEIRSLAVEAAKTMGEIMLNKTIEPDIRLKAAITLVERNLGKTPTVVAITGDKPFEEIFDDIAHGTREQSRQRRAITSERVVEAEVVDPPQSGDSEANAYGDKTIDDGVGSSEGQLDTGNSGDSDEPVQEDPMGNRSESARDARLFARDDAILAQTIEVKPFEYDLSDSSEEVKRATKRRYATKVLEVDPLPYVRTETDLPNGNRLIKYVEPEPVSTPKRGKKTDLKRKLYTLSDF